MITTNEINDILDFSVITLRDDIAVNTRLNIESMVRSKHAVAQNNDMYVVFISFYGGDNMQILVPKAIIDNGLLEKEESAEYNYSGCKIKIMDIEHLFSAAVNGMTELKEIENLYTK